eukprot:12527097-Prorocentrum_lima.AAC.1
MPHGVSEVQGHRKSIVYWASRFLQRADVASRQLLEDMDFSCNDDRSLPAHLGTVPTCIPKT